MSSSASTPIFDRAQVNVGEHDVNTCRQRPKLLKHFALYFLSSFALSEINRPEASPMRTHMPFRRTCQRLLMRSLLKEWRVEERVEKDLNRSSISDPTYIISPLNICIEMLGAFGQSTFFEEFIKPFVDSLLANLRLVEQVEPALMKANLNPDAFWILEHEAMCFLAQIVEKRAEGSAIENLQMPAWWQITSSVLCCSTILLDNCRETAEQFWEQERRAREENVSLRERLSSSVVKYWWVGRQARAAGRFLTAQQIFHLGGKSAGRSPQNEALFLRQEAETACALAHEGIEDDDDTDDAFAADFTTQEDEKRAAAVPSTSLTGIRRRQATALLERLLEIEQRSETTRRSAHHSLAQLYKKQKDMRRAIEHEERRLKMLRDLPGVYPRTLAQSRYFIAKCYRAMGDMERFRDESQKGIEEFDAKPEYKQGKLALQYARSTEIFTWKLDYFSYTESAPYLSKAIEVLDEECRRSRIEDGISIPNSDLNYDALYTKQAMAALIRLSAGEFVAEEKEAAEYRARHPELDLRSLVLQYAADKLLLAKNHMRTDYYWIVGFYAQATALLAELKEDKFTTLDTVLRFLRQSVTRDGKPLLPQSMRYTVQTAEDLEFKVLYSQQQQDGGDSCSFRFPIDDIVARMKEAGELSYAEPLTSAIRLCYKLHPERGKIKISAASHKMLLDFANFKEGCGTPIYRQMMRDALACTDPR